MKRAKLKNIPELPLEISKLSHDGRGIASIDGKTTFVHGALPGETVLCKITYQHKRYNEGNATEILKKANERIAPACQHFGTCGGCSLQHLAMDNQLKHKQEVLLEQLYHFGNVTPEEILPPLSGSSFGYRGKARLGVKYVIKKEKLLVGFREKHSNLLAEIDHCPILRPSVANLIKELRIVIANLSQFDSIPQVEVAIGDDDTTALVFRHLKTLSEKDKSLLGEFGATHHLHIYLQPNPPDPIYKLFPNDTIEQLIYSLPEYNINMQFHPLMFTQVNSEMNPRMIKLALQLLALKNDETILDLFCGLGNFTLPIARFAKNVVGIEGSDTMVKVAEQNAFSNNIPNARFYSANLMKPSAMDAWIKNKYHKILLDPPRTGAKEIIPYFQQFSAEKIVYVSCNPATLARDAGELVHKQGYHLKKVGIINMFPNTSHIEAIALFEK